MNADRTPGQALVEFSISITIFLMLLMALFDFGRAIYIYNGVSQAAREVARTASVYRASGWSTEAQATIATQRGLIPGLNFLTPKCVGSTEPDNSAGTPGPCDDGDYLVVTARSSYAPVSLLGFLGTINVEAHSRVQAPLGQAK